MIGGGRTIRHTRDFKKNRSLIARVEVSEASSHLLAGGHWARSDPCEFLYEQDEIRVPASNLIGARLAARQTSPNLAAPRDKIWQRRI